MKQKNKDKSISYLNPRGWPLLLFIGLYRLLIFLPYRWQLKLGKLAGNLLYRLPIASKTHARTNIKLCYPEYDEQQREALLRANFQSLGIAIFETGMGWWASNKRLRKLAHVSGAEHFHRAQAQGKGIIVLGAHFTCLELVGRLFSQYSDFAVIYRNPKHPLLSRLITDARRPHYSGLFKRNDIRGIVKCIQSGVYFWYSPDIDPGRQRGIFAPFFGYPAYTLTATSRLAKLANAVVLPVSHYRRDDGNGYDLIVHPALDNFPSEDIEADTHRVNQTVENMVREKPEQYLWLYRRFKTRPQGEERFY